MAAMYWIGDAVGGDVWSNPQAWSLASGGAPAGAIPVAADDVYFDAASVRNCTLDMNATGANSIITMDCNGYAQTFNQAGFTIEITGLTFLLSAAMTFNHGGGLVDFTSVAGVVAITVPAPKQLGTVRTGNAGAGGTYQQQGNVAISANLDCVNGIWQCNNFNFSIQGNLIFEITMLANGFVAGTGVISLGGVIDWNANAAVIAMGTSTFAFTGAACGITMDGLTGGLTIDLYNMTINCPGGMFTYGGTLAGGVVNVNNTFLVTAGDMTMTGVGDGIRVTSTLVNGFQPSAADLVDVPIILQPRTGAGTTVTIPAHTNMRTFTLVRDVATYDTCVFQLTGAVATGNVLAYAPGAGVRPTLDLNGNNWTVTGNVTFGNGANGFGRCDIGAATLSMTGNLLHLGNPDADSRLFVISAGQLLVGGNFQHNGALSVLGQRINLDTAALVRVGGNWDTTPVVVFSPLLPGDTSNVEFTAAGGFTIACDVGEIWPVVRITGGGTVALPNPFVCTDLIITAGLVTAGAVLHVLRAFSNAGTFTGGADMYVGTGFVNTGVVVMAGVNLHLVGPVTSVSGFNPTTLTMEATLLRLQLTAALNVTTAFVIADRLMPGVIQLLAGANFTFATLNSQVLSTDGTIQVVSSVAGTRYNLTVTALTSGQNTWWRDCNYAGAAFVGDLTNRDLGNNAGMTLNFPPAFIRVISEDAGQDLLAAGGIGPINYCWLVATSQANLAAAAAAFAGGANNWHRKTNIPFSMLDNLVKGTTYWIGLGLVDDRNRRVAPNVGAGDFATTVATADESGRGGANRIHVNVKVATMS